MIRRVANGVKLQLKVQWRSFFPHVYLGMAALVIAVFRFAVPAEYTEWFLPVFVFTSGSSARMSPTPRVGGSAWIRRWVARCCAGRSGTR